MFTGVFVDGSVVWLCSVHVLSGICGWECGLAMFCPRSGVFLWTGVWFSGVPSTYWSVFVAGSVDWLCSVHVLGRFVDGSVVQ